MQVFSDVVDLSKHILYLRSILLRNSLTGIFFACHKLPSSQHEQPFYLRLVFVLKMFRMERTISRSELMRSASSSAAFARRRSFLSLYTPASTPPICTTFCARTI